MNQKPIPPAAPTPTAADARKDRLAAALRENLKRRKAQQRARAAHADTDDAKAPNTGK